MGRGSCMHIYIYMHLYIYDIYICFLFARGRSQEGRQNEELCSFERRIFFKKEETCLEENWC